MAKNKKSAMSDEQIINRISKITQNAVGINSSTLTNRWETAYNLYMRKPLPGDSEIHGRSKFVSNEVQVTTDWSVSSVLRVFDTQREPVSFKANTGSGQKAAQAQQQTDVVNFMLRQRTKHAKVLHDWLKDGFLYGLSVVYTRFVNEDEEGLEISLKGVNDEALANLTEQHESGAVKLTDIGDEYDAPSHIPEEQMSPEMQVISQFLKPQVRDVKYRKVTSNPEMLIRNIPIENFIVSKDADFDESTGGIRAELQGHMRTVCRAELIEMGYDEDIVDSIPQSSNNKYGVGYLRTEPVDYDREDSGNEDDVTLYEIYTKMNLDGERSRNYRFMLAGELPNGVVLLEEPEEVSKFYPYAAFCPYPTPGTLFGQGVADRVGDVQVYISKMMRFVFDNLAAHANPVKIINPEVTNVDDALNIYPGATIRSSDPTGGISYQQQAFTGGNALQVIDAVAAKLDFATGVGPSMMSLNGSDLQVETATGASQRANSSQLFMEMICRQFAETGYAYLVKVIVDQLVQNPEDAQKYIARLTEHFVPIQVDAWDPNMDVSANVAFGVMNKDYNAQQLQIIMQMQDKAASMGLVKQQQVYNAMAKYAENAGYTTPNDFFLDPATLPPPPPPPPPPQPAQPDPNTLGLIEVEKVKAQLQAQSDAQKRDFEMRKLIVTSDLDRDRMAQDRWLKEAEITARYHAQVNDAAIQQEQAMKRNDVDLAMAQMDQQNQAMEQLSQIHQAQQAQQAQTQQAAMGHLAGLAGQQAQSQQQPQAPQQPQQ